MKYEEGEKEMKKRRGNFLAGLLAIVMLMTTVLSGTGGPGAVQAEEQTQDAVWEELSGIMGSFADKAVWTDTKYTDAITKQMPSTALLGNGDAGITSYGNATEKTYLISTTDFWTDNSRYFGHVGRSPQLITGGGLTIAPAKDGHEYNLAYGCDVTASSETRYHEGELTVQGMYTNNVNGDGDTFTGWQASGADMPQWLLYRFSFQQKVDRLVIRHDNYTSKKGEDRNTRDFKVQTLPLNINPDDAKEEDWITIKEVKDNASDVTNIKFDQPMGLQYVRILIEKATADGGDGIGRISQFEAYYQNDDYNMPIEDNKVSSHPYNRAYEMPVTASSETEGHEASKAVGGVKQTEGWVSEIGQQQTLTVDLNVPTLINRWHVKHDNLTSRQGDIRNTRDFSLQVSLDGKTWQTIDSVSNNTQDITDRRLLYDYKARYVRLQITKASGESDDAARARISQFELYYDNNYDTSLATDAKGAKAETSSIMNDGRGAANVINNNWTTKSGAYNDYCGWVSNTKPTPHWVQMLSLIHI